MHPAADAETACERLRARFRLVSPDDDQVRLGIRATLERAEESEHALALETTADEDVGHRTTGNAELCPGRYAVRFAQPRVEALEVHTVVNDMELVLGDVEPRPNLVLHHARIADHRAKPRAREQATLGREYIAVVGIERDTDPGERAESGAAVMQPLSVHAVPS